MKSHFSRTFLGVLLGTLLCSGAMARTLEFKTTQVTDADVAVAPDGKQLVFTILGHLYRVPVQGGAAEQLTFGPCYDNEPAFAPDGRRIAFVSDRDKSGGNVFVLDLASNKLTQVTREIHAGLPTWMPDGKTLLYLRYLPREDNPRPRSLFGGPTLCDLRKIALDPDAKPEILRRPGFLKSIFLLSGAQPAWTVVEQEAGGGGFMVRSTTHVETLTAKDGKVVRLRSVQGDIGRVVGSPKGDGFYYRSGGVRFLPLAEAEVRPAPIPGGGAGFGPGGAATRFAVTADGKIAYESSRGQLAKITLDSGAREVIPFQANIKQEVTDPMRPRWTPAEIGGAVRPRGLLNPEISRDGRSLTFMAAGYLWQQPLDGKPARRLLKGDAWECEPSLAPDGRQLAFVRGHQGKRELRVVELESGNERMLMDLGSDSWARFLNWSGDGKRLVFQKSIGLQSPFELVAVSVSDGKLEKLASAVGNWSSRPHFTPEGDAIYFTSRIDGPGSLYRLPLKDKGKPDAVTRLARHLSSARVSPNGKWLAFRRNSEIWAAPLGADPVEEKNVRRLSPEGGATFGFTPDSSAVIYSVGNRVWRQPLDGGKVQEMPVRLDWRCPTPPPLLLRRVRVLDFAAGRFSKETSLLVERGAIRWIGSEREHPLPEGVVIFDAAGKYAIPGLFDFHVHAAWANYEAHPDTFLAYGVTSVRDTGGGLETLCALADRGDTSGDPLPRYFFSGEIFEGAQPIWGDAFLQIYTPDEARNHVQRWKERGAHFIKVYSSLPWSLHHAAADEARRQGMPVVGHGLGLEEIVKSVTEGYLSLEHCPMSLNDDVKRMLAAAGTRCDPTLAILGGHSNLLRRDPKRLDDPKLRRFFSESFIRASRSGGFPGMGASWPDRLAQLQAAHRAGVKLHAGTDSLMTGTFFGQSLHWELEHLVEAGLKPLEVLRAATEEAAAVVGADGHLGKLAPGLLADIVLLDADPLENIRNTQAIWRVVRGGWVFDPKTLRPAARPEG
jgi:imidazolonepropionase-like amidohydrolase/Tol biopolymer transport system component